MSFAHAEDPRPVAVFQQGSMVRISGLDEATRAEIEKQLTVTNPKIEQLKRWSGWVQSNIPKYIYGFVRSGDDLLVAPGFAARAWVIARNEGYRVELADPVFRFPPATIDLAYNGEARPYQDRVIRTLRPIRHALAVMPTGSGKTDTIVRLVCDVDVRVLVLVHTVELMRQWVERFELRTGYTPSTYGGGKGKKKRVQLTGEEKVIVATVQSVRRSPAILKMLAESREMVVLDEAHHAPAATFMDLLSQLHPSYRYGITATDQRADGLTPLMHWWIGPIRARVERGEVVADGFIVDPELCVYETGFRFVFDRDETGQFQKMVEALALDPERLFGFTRCIAAAAQSNQDRRHLVRCSNIAGAEAITAALNGHWKTRARLLTGQTKKPERAEIVEEIKAGTLPVVVTSTVADEGLDAPALSDLWLATPLKDPGKLTQVIGRIVRPADGKPLPRVHDFVDPLVISHGVDQRTGESTESRTLLNQFRARYGKVYADVCVGGHDEAKRLIAKWRNK